MIFQIDIPEMTGNQKAVLTHDLWEIIADAEGVSRYAKCPAISCRSGHSSVLFSSCCFMNRSIASGLYITRVPILQHANGPRGAVIPQSVRSLIPNALAVSLADKSFFSMVACMILAPVQMGVCEVDAPNGFAVRCVASIIQSSRETSKRNQP